VHFCRQERESVKIFHLNNGQSDGLTPFSSDYFASVNDKKMPTNTIQFVMRNPRKRHLPKLDMTGAGIFAPTHKHRPSF